MSHPSPAPLPPAGQALAEPFPVRVACVDMGSNAIRFVAAEFSGPGEMHQLALDRQPVRLGHGVFLSGRLDAAAVDQAVAALAGFAGEMERHEVHHYRAVATSAVREAANGAELVERVRNEAGLDLDVISGSEEARLVHLAVADRVPLDDRQWILVDLGGGSVEVSLVDGSGILWSESHTMGSVRLLEELASSGQEPGRFQRLLEEYVATLRIPSAASQLRPAGFIATGGNIEALARIAGAPDDARVATIRVGELRAAIALLARLSFRQRVDELGLREDRADVILPAAMVYERLAVLAGADEVVVPRVGIKEGVLADLVGRLTRREQRDDRQLREVQAAGQAIGRRYMFDEPHAAHVARLAVSLFDQLQALHRLSEDDRRILLAAALLHDIGQYVSYKGHHKHSLYLISHSELPSFSAREMQMVANVARYHRKSGPSSSHPAFTALAEPDRDRVTRLAALLRVADALDREHVQRVTGITARIDDRTVELVLEGDGDLLLEGWSVKRKAQLFVDVYRRRLELAFERSAE